MSWYIDVYDAGGTKSGSGPITSATGWRSTLRMDKGGEFSFSAPLADAKVRALTPLAIVRCMALVGSAWREVGAGIVERIERRVEDTGAITAVVSGCDLVGLLATLTVRTRYVGGGTTVAIPQAAVTHAAALEVLEAISADAPTGRWEFVPDGAPVVNALVGGWNYESLLQALITLAEKCGSHFYYSGTNQITFAGASSASGVRAVAALGTLSSALAAISQLAEIEDGAEIVSYLLPFGGGNADARLTINATTQTPPSGYAFEDLTIYASPATTVRALVRSGATQTRQQARVWNNITPVSSSAADIQAAADALYYQALRYMQQRAQAEKFYELTLAACPVVLRPTQTIRVSFHDAAQGIEIEDDLIVLEATTECGADGPITTGCVVSTVDRWPDSDIETVVQRLASGQLYQVAPQLNANSYVIAYEKPIDDTETATFRFRFDSEVVQLTRLTFDFQLQPLESTVKSVGASSVTSTSDGSHTHSVTLPNHTHSVTLANHTHSVTVGNHTHTVTLSNHTHTVAISSHTHSVTLPNHTHGVTWGDHDHDVPIDADPNPTGNHPYARIVYYDPTDDNFYFEAASGSGFVVGTSDGGGKSVTSGNGGGTTATSSSGGSATITSGDGGGTTATSSSGGGTTVTSGDGGGTTVTSGDGGGTTQTSSSGGSHSHTVTPVVTTTYGIFRDSAANTFGLTDLEYSVDGSTWYGFAVGVNGFAALGDGWYRVDLTALLQDATTLRPTSSNNALRVRKKAAGAAKKASIEAQINVRTIIQAIAAI